MPRPDLPRTISPHKKDSTGQMVARARLDHVESLFHTLRNELSWLIPRILVRHLKSEAAYAARGPTDRPPRSWRATHFNQFPWRTAVTTTWPLRRLPSHLRYRSLSLSPELRFEADRRTDSAKASIFANHHRPASLRPGRSKGAAAAILVIDALRMCG